MEIAIGIVLGIAALWFITSLGSVPPSTDARENFRAVHGRYPTDADYEDPIS